MRGYSESAKSQYVGDIVAFDRASQMAEINVRNRFAVGDRLELLLPGGNQVVQLERMETLTGRSHDVAPGSGWTVRIPLPPGDFSQGLVARFLS